MKAWYVMMCFVLMTSNGLSGYRKFQCVTYDYKIPGKQNVANAQCLTQYGQFSLKADYVIKGPSGATSWVRLSLADKRHMRRLFDLFSPSTLVTDAMIASFLYGKKRKWKVVGLILRDFKTAYGPTITLQKMRDTLKL